MAKTIAKKSSGGGGRLLAKATTVKSKTKIKLPGKPAPKPAKTVKKTTAAPLPVKPPKTKMPATKVGAKAVLSPDRAAIAGKPLLAKSPVKSAATNGVAVPPRSSPVPTVKPTPAAVKSPPTPPQIIPRPVATDGKPRKNQAGLSSKELDVYRELLLTKRRELVGDMSSMEREALRNHNSTVSTLSAPSSEAGTDNYEQEFTLGLVEKDRHLLREINRALGKIQDGTYGICEGTGKPISKPRLEAQPWAKYSIEYARELEKRGGRR